MRQPRPIFLFTDFGFAGPYVGQMIAAIHAVAPHSTVINLMHDAPAMRPELAAYLLPACCSVLAAGSIVVAVVDPGVGGGRDALIVESAGVSYVGPDNGLLSRLARIDRASRIDWRPERLSASFHGRDLFAPVAARLSVGDTPAATPLEAGSLCGADWPEQSERVVYIDGYGNVMTGLRADKVNENNVIIAGGRPLGYAETFSRVAAGELFWYRNSLGLVEIAANRAAAADLLALAPGDRILLD